MLRAARLVHGIRNWSCSWVITSPFPSGTTSRFLSSLESKIKKYRKMQNLTEPPNWTQLYQERFIPLSKDQLLRHLLQEFHSSPSEEAALREFALQVDFYILYQYKHMLSQLQALYHSIRPDSDTMHQPTATDLQHQDKEQEVLRVLEHLLEQANFSPLPEEVMAFSLSMQQSQNMIKVSADVKQYAFMRFWALGQRKGRLSNVGTERGFFAKMTSAERLYFKRVVVAARTKQGQMELKSFKDTPLDSLEYLLPGVKTQMPRLHVALINTMVAMSSLVAFVNVGLVAAAFLDMATSMLLLFFISVMGHRTFKIFTQQRRLENLELVHLLFSHTTSNESELITTLVLRAQEEHTKEVLLAHSFMGRRRDSSQEESAEWLQKNVESWLLTRVGYKVTFNGARALGHHRVLLANMPLGPLPSLPKSSNPLWIPHLTKTLDSLQIQSFRD